MDDHDQMEDVDVSSPPASAIVMNDSGRRGRPARKWIAVIVLLTVNLLNYMDRFTIAGVLGRLQEYFHMNDQQAGMLQTVFIVAYMLFAPVCGYLGDRYNRKTLMFCGLVIWICAVLLSTTVSPDQLWLFFLFRGLVGIGEASYSTVAPTIIADSFTGPARSTVLMIFYFAVPVGSGLGYIGGSYVALWTGSWQGGVRFTPFLGIGCLLLIALVLEEPKRGQAEHAELEPSGLKEDLAYLTTVKTYRYTTLGFTSVVFAVGALSWWTPTLIGYAYGIQHGVVPKEEMAQVALVFGMITCAAGIVGVVMGSTIAQAWRQGRWGLRPSPRADAYVCAAGSLLAIPFLFGCLVVASHSITAAWVLMFFAVTCMCLNWAVNMDILMYVIVANRRATATAIQTLMSHLFGDATSPYIVGTISDAIRGANLSTVSRFYALQTALFVPTFLLVASGGFYLWSSFHMEADQKEACYTMHIPTSAWEGGDDDVETLVARVRQESVPGGEDGAGEEEA